MSIMPIERRGDTTPEIRYDQRGRACEVTTYCISGGSMLCSYSLALRENNRYHERHENPENGGWSRYVTDERLDQLKEREKAGSGGIPALAILGKTRAEVESILATRNLEGKINHVN